MHYFLIQENDQLIHLPDCHFEEGKRELREIRQLGGPPIFSQGRKLPDIFTFTIPSGSSITPCLVVDQNAIVRRVLVSPTEIRIHTFMAAGVVEEQFEAPDMQKAKAAISKAVSEICD